MPSTQNAPIKFSMYVCEDCDFQTDAIEVANDHRDYNHYVFLLEE